MPNQLSKIVEERIVAFALGHPGLGPKRVSGELARPRCSGILVSPNGVWKVLCRHGLNTRAKRLGLIAGYAAPYEPPRDPGPEATPTSCVPGGLRHPRIGLGWRRMRNDLADEKPNMPIARRPFAVDLFAGAGGLSLGLEQAGFDVVAAVEYDPVHAATHEFNFPRTEMLCADVSAPLKPDTLRKAARKGIEAHGHNAESWDGELDLVAGGPPCQGFSLIGKRLKDDTRNRLVFHFFRIVRALKPRYFVMENVPGMATGGHASILDRLISEFEEIGYRFPDEGTFRILNAADFGVPQERHRLFLIGTRLDQENVARPPQPTVAPVPKRAADSADHDIALPKGPNVIEAIGDIPNLNRFPSLLSSDRVTLSKANLAWMDEKCSSYARRLRGIDKDPDDHSYPRIWERSVLTGSMRTIHTRDSINRFKSTEPGETESVSRFYRLDPQGLCNTLRAGSGSERGAFTSPRPLHPTLPRVLSNREAARLHSFPDWFRPHETKWHGFRQIGNAVAPLVGRSVGQRIVDALAIEVSRPEECIELGDQRLLGMRMSVAAKHFGADRTQIPAQRTRTSGSAVTSRHTKEGTGAAVSPQRVALAQ